MNLNLIVIILGIAFTYQVQASSANDYYIGAVVEFNPSLILDENLKEYEQLIKEASKQKADIVVFPEGGLMPLLRSFVLPDPLDNISPCGNAQFSNVVQSLSCAAKNNSIYVVVNLKEKRIIINSTGEENTVYYNTNVVFDRNGYVIARYAKYNLFNENSDRPPKPEPIFFTTDFGVTFGTFICFDILFQEPTLRLARQYGVTDFVFSTFWFSEMPFLTAYQVQQGWAEVNHVNLLASGVNNPLLGSTGSGIYNGKWGPLVVTFEDKPATKLLVARVKKIQNTKQNDFLPLPMPSFSNVVLDFRKKHSFKTNQTAIEEVELKLLHDQIYLFKSEKVTMGNFEAKVCSNNDFCCSFKVEVDKISKNDTEYNYRAVAFDGIRMFGEKFWGGAQSCGLILCVGPELLNCTNRAISNSNIFEFRKIEIKGNFLSTNAFQFPSTLIGKPELEALPPNTYLFKTAKDGSMKQTVSMELLWPVTNLQTFAIWGRNFVEDNKKNTIISGVSSLLPYSALLLFLSFLSILSNF